MKKSFLVTITICFSVSISAQKIHFTDTSNKWQQMYDAYTGSTPTITFGVHKYLSDTTIASVNYKIFDFGAIREDTILKKVYIRDFTGDSETVLMDYNLNVGDSFTTNYDTFFHFYYTYVVSGIDSTLINGVWHRVWHFPPLNNASGTNWASDVIEGVGCIQHPTYMIWHGMGVEPIDPKEFCFSNQGITPPFSPPVSWFDNTTSCTTFPALYTYQLQPILDKITIYPNPATNELTITTTDPITNITISNILGQVMYTYKYNSPQVQVDVSTLPAGVYFIKVNGTEVRKFIKQ